jgi:hypothetical protein
MSATGRVSRDRRSPLPALSPARGPRSVSSQLEQVGPRGWAVRHWRRAFHSRPPATTRAAREVVRSSGTGWKTWESEAHHARIPIPTGRMGAEVRCLSTPRDRATPARITVVPRSPSSTAGLSTNAGETSTRRGAAAQWTAQRRGATEAHPQGCGTSRRNMGTGGGQASGLGPGLGEDQERRSPLTRKEYQILHPCGQPSRNSGSCCTFLEGKYTGPPMGPVLPCGAWGPFTRWNTGGRRGPLGLLSSASSGVRGPCSTKSRHVWNRSSKR